MLGMVDISVFRFINKAMANPVFDKLMPILTRLGTGEIILYVAIIIIIFARRERKFSGVLLLAGLTVTYYVVDNMKNAFAVPRPFISLADVRMLVTKASGYSFPSGHSVTAFMAAAIASRCFRSGAAIWMALAVIVAFSRVYIGVHYPSDVIFGALIGLIIGYAIIKVSDNFRQQYN